MQKEFKLLSINIIAYLKTKGVYPLKVEKNEEGKVVHVFDNTNELHFYLKEYKNDQNLQNFISSLSDTRKQIKSLV